MEARTGSIVIGRAHSPASRSRTLAQSQQGAVRDYSLLGEAKAVAVADGGGGSAGTISTTPGDFKSNHPAVRMTRERDRWRATQTERARRGQQRSFPGKMRNERQGRGRDWTSPRVHRVE